MPFPSNFVSKVVATLIQNDAHTAVLYLTPTFVARATRVLYEGKIPRVNRIEVVLTMGRPNYAAREHIKVLQKAGEKFPVRKVHLTFPPKRKGARAGSVN